MWGFNRSVDSQLQKDKDDLYKLGYIQELDRSIGVFSNFAISFSIISILTGLITLYDLGLYYSGLANFWSWLIVGPFQFILVLAMAEIASRFPLAGGAYKWVELLGNKHLSWFCGWVSIIGWLACTAGIDLGLGDFIITFIGVDRGNYFVLILILIIVISIHAIINMKGIKQVTKVNNFSVIIHISGVVIISILLLIFGRKHSMDFLFSVHAMKPGFFIGGLLSTLLMSAWTITGFDASANISEESLNPSKTVPYGMILSVGVSFIFGIILLLSMAQAIPDVNQTLASKTSAFFFIVGNTLGPIVSRFIIIIVMIAMFACGLGAQTLLVRVIYSFSRDNGLPYSNIWKYVPNKYETPVYGIAIACIATIFISIIAIVLSKITIISDTKGMQGFQALPIITGLSTLCIYLSHAIALGAAIFNKSDMWKHKGPFNLGKLSLVIEIIAFIWASFISVTVFILNPVVAFVFITILLLLIVYYLIKVDKNEMFGKKTLSVNELKRIEKLRKN